MKMSTVGRAYFLHSWINANEPIHEGNKNEAFDTFFCLRKNKNVLMQKSKNIRSMSNVCVYYQNIHIYTYFHTSASNNSVQRKILLKYY